MPESTTIVIELHPDKVRLGRRVSVEQSAAPGPVFPMIGQLRNIPRGASGLRAKIKEIKRLVELGKRDPNFRQQTVRLVMGVRERDWTEEIRRVVRFVQKIRYTADPYSEEGLEAFIDPRIMMAQVLNNDGAGDCDDHVILAATMLEVIGHQVRYRVGGTQRGVYQHIWLDVLDKSRGWVPVELIRDEIPVGVDPAPSFPHTETFKGALMGATYSMVPQAGGNVSMTRVIRSDAPDYYGFLPSDMMRAATLADDTIPGMSSADFHKPKDDLGWVVAVATLLAAAYGTYEEKEAKKKARRDVEDANRRNPMGPQRALPSTYVSYGTRLQQGLVATKDMWGDPVPTTAEATLIATQGYQQHEAQRGRGRQANYGAMATRAVQAWQARSPDGRRDGRSGGQVAFDADFARAMRGENFDQAETQSEVYGPQQPIQRGRRAVRSRAETELQKLEKYLQYLPPEQRSALYRKVADAKWRAESYNVGQGIRGLAGLGQEPPNPGPYNPKTKPFVQWKVLAEETGRSKDEKWKDPISGKGRWWFVWDQMMAAAQGPQDTSGLDWWYLGIGEAIGEDALAKYPGISGNKGGRVGWLAAWGGGNEANLLASAVQLWLSLTIDTSDPKVVGRTAVNWLGQVKWTRDHLYGAIERSWMMGEAKRKVEWQIKYDLWKSYHDKIAKDAAAKKRSEDAARRAAEAKVLAEAEKARLELLRKEQEAANQAKAAADEERARLEAAQRRRDRQNAIPSSSGRTSRRAPPLIGPPRAPKKSNTMLWVGVAGVAALFFMKKKKRR